MVTVTLPDGVDAWVKLRATNNGDGVLGVRCEGV